MSEPLITVRHQEYAVITEQMCSPNVRRSGMDVAAEITFGVGEHQSALEAVDRIAADLRRQIADAAESGAMVTRPCAGKSSNVCVAEGCYGEACMKEAQT